MFVNGFQVRLFIFVLCLMLCTLDLCCQSNSIYAIRTAAPHLLFRVLSVLVGIEAIAEKPRRRQRRLEEVAKQQQ